MSFSKKSPHNGCHFSGVITDNPENFALYKVLQLDVFETDIPPMAVVISDDPNTGIQAINLEFDSEFIDLESKPKKKKK